VNSLRGKAAVVGVGETTYYKRGNAPDPEFVMALKAILAACEDAEIDPRDIDGFASFHNERSDSVRLAAALGIKELRFSNLQWGGGGGGGSGAVGNAAAAIAGGLADCVVVHRSLAQGQFGRFGQAAPIQTISGEGAFTWPYGLMSPAHMFAMRTMRFMHDHKIRQEALRALALASYHHAQRNPRAVMHGRPLSEEQYDESRWIVEPYKLYDCCMENDCAAALVLVSAERAKDMKQKPAYVIGAAQGSEYRNGAGVHNAPTYATGGFNTVAPRLYDMAKVEPADVDVVQAYENFTGGVLMALVEHGFFEADEANEFLTLANLTAPKGKLPLNTSGGNLAECYVHGLEHHTEAVRQIRGQSTAQVPGAEVSLVISGPMVNPISSVIYGSGATL
jgi:acetyl-CoA acetyltransferase